MTMTNNEPGADQCSICRDAIKQPATLDPCQHRFCSACITKWMRRNFMPSFGDKKCPECRQKVKGFVNQVVVQVEEEVDTRLTVSGPASAVIKLLDQQQSATGTRNNETIADHCSNALGMALMTFGIFFGVGFAFLVIGAIVLLANMFIKP